MKLFTAPKIDGGMTEEMYRQLQREELAYRAKMTDFSDPKAREEYINYSNALAQGQKND